MERLETTSGLPRGMTEEGLIAQFQVARSELPGLYVVGSQVEAHYLTLTFHPDGRITGFDPQNGMVYEGLEQLSARMGGDFGFMWHIAPPSSTGTP
jgi:hypothetical protein